MIELPWVALDWSRVTTCTVASLLLAAMWIAPSDTLADEQSDTAPAPSASRDEIRRWIVELGHDSYHVRQAAAERLLAAGKSARQALVELGRGHDPETRAAAQRLVVLIERDEFDRRLKAFLNDLDGKRGLTLPGWEAFRELMGDDRAARSLFVEMHRIEGATLAGVFAADRSRSVPWEERLLQQHQSWAMNVGTEPETRPVGSLAAMLFLGVTPEGRISDRGVMILAQVLNTSPVGQTIRSGDHHEMLRRLLVAWVTGCPNRSEEGLRQRLAVAATHSLREALPLALAVAHNDPEYLAIQPSTRALAILNAGRLGGPEHVAELEPLLEDDTVCRQIHTGGALRPNGIRGMATIEVRDVALIALLQLTEQDPAEYGFIQVARHPQGIYSLGTIYFHSDARRTAAVEKWRRWRSDQSRAETPDPAGGEAKASS